MPTSPAWAPLTYTPCRQMSAVSTPHLYPLQADASTPHLYTLQADDSTPHLYTLQADVSSKRYAETANAFSQGFLPKAAAAYINITSGTGEGYRNTLLMTLRSVV